MSLYDIFMVNLFLDVYFFIVLAFDRLITSRNEGYAATQDGGALKLKLMHVGVVSALPILIGLLVALYLGWI